MPAPAFPEPRFILTNGIGMAVHEQGEGLPVLLSHGFPELAYSWRYQLPALAAAGFRAIAPDQRGYGETDRPRAVEAYDIHELCADLVGLLDALELERAVVCGHRAGRRSRSMGCASCSATSTTSCTSRRPATPTSGSEATRAACSTSSCARGRRRRRQHLPGAAGAAR